MVCVEGMFLLLGWSGPLRALRDAFVFADGPASSGGLRVDRDALFLRSIGLGSAEVRTLRSNYTNPSDGGSVPSHLCGIKGRGSRL